METVRAQRNYTDNLTVLSGDIEGNDTDPEMDGVVVTATHIVGDNSYHVLYSSGVTCTAGFDNGTVVTLTVTAASGSRFIGWSGVLSGSAISDTITITQGETVTTTFHNRFSIFLPYLSTAAHPDLVVQSLTVTGGQRGGGGYSQ